MTIYAFSIENFKRSKFEVDALMEMAKVKLSQLSQHGDLLDRYGASVRVLGRRDFVRPDVLESIDRAVELTSRNGDAILNICFPYTSRDEITCAIRNTVIDYSTPLDRSQIAAGNNVSKRPFSESHIVRNIREQAPSAEPKGLGKTNAQQNPAEAEKASDSNSDSSTSLSSSTTLNQPNAGKTTTLPELYSSYPPNSDQVIFLSPETITTKTLDDHMLTAGNPPLDLLVRTSGVERLSDFMLWQCHQNTHLVFLETLWPAFGLMDFLPVLWEWQWRVRKQGKSRDFDFDASDSENAWASDDEGEAQVKVKAL